MGSRVNVQGQDSKKEKTESAHYENQQQQKRKKKKKEKRKQNKNTHTKKQRKWLGLLGTTQLTLAWINLRLKVIRDYYRKFRKPRKEVAEVVKRLAYNVGDLGSIPGSRRSSGEGNGTPLQYSCLENPMDRGAWWATVHGVAKSRTRLSDITHSLYVGQSDFYTQTFSQNSQSNFKRQPLLLLLLNLFYGKGQQLFQDHKAFGTAGVWPPSTCF